MKKYLIALSALAAMALALPAGASAGTGTDCSYATDGTGAGGVVVYTSPGSASSSLLGVCVDEGPGGTLEVGSNGGDCTYIVADGDNDNPDPGDGYMGLSNCEEPGSADPTCDADDGGTGTNSGGCFGVKGVAGPFALPDEIPTPICGNTSGPSWTDSQRDGCQIP